MELEAVLDVLRLRQALIIHFSHRSNMRDGGVFPDDLLAAIANRSCWALSCCVVWPGHTMKLPGQVGIIFQPTAVEQILSVSNMDSGSWQSACGEDFSGGDRNLTSDNLAQTFSVPPGEDYNEWRVRGADVLGVFVESTGYVLAKKRQLLETSGADTLEDIWPARFSLAQVRAAFPGLDLITMTDKGPRIVDGAASQETLR